FEIHNHDAAPDLVGNLREEFMPLAARAVELRYVRLPLEFLIERSLTDNSTTERHGVATGHLCHTAETFALVSHGGAKSPVWGADRSVLTKHWPRNLLWITSVQRRVCKLGEHDQLVHSSIRGIGKGVF